MWYVYWQWPTGSDLYIYRVLFQADGQGKPSPGLNIGILLLNSYHVHSFPCLTPEPFLDDSLISHGYSWVFPIVDAWEWKEEGNPTLSTPSPKPVGSKRWANRTPSLPSFSHLSQSHDLFSPSSPVSDNNIYYTGDY